jgi:phage FluMu protein Com
MKVTLVRDDGTTREVETTQALVIYQEGDEIAVMGDCNALFIQIIEAADIIGQTTRKQTAALAAKQASMESETLLSVGAKCPKCSQVNVFNFTNRTIHETTAAWFMCSFCHQPSGRVEWQQESGIKPLLGPAPTLCPACDELIFNTIPHNCQEDYAFNIKGRGAQHIPYEVGPAESEAPGCPNCCPGSCEQAAREEWPE